MEDERIVELFFRRSEDALKGTHEKYGAYCFPIARNILQNENDAEECVNDAYLKVWNAIPKKEWLTSALKDGYPIPLPVTVSPTKAKLTLRCFCPTSLEHLTTCLRAIMANPTEERVTGKPVGDKI